MTAVTDLTTVLTILGGSAPTNAQLNKIADLYKDYLQTDTPTNEQRAQAVLIGMRKEIRQKLRAVAEKAVYSAVIAQAHYPADQPAMLAAARAAADAAGEAAGGNL